MDLLKRQKFSFFLCCILLIFSCQSTEQNSSIPTIEAEVTSDAELKLSECFENFRILRLQTDSVIGEIERVKYENSRIYISDKYSLFVFSDDGKLLSSIRKRGKGPGEYSGITDFMVDGETIIILDRGQKKLLSYDNSGKSILTHNIKYYAQAISPMVNKSFFLYVFDPLFSYKLHRMRNGQEDAMYLAADENQTRNNLLLFSFHNFYEHQESIYFIQPLNDTIYKSIGGGSMKPFFYVDFKGKNIPASFFRKQHRDVIAFYDELHEKSYAAGVNNIALSDRFLMFNSFYQRGVKLTVFDRKNNSSNTFASIKDDIYFNDLSIPISEFKYHANSRIFVPLDASLVYEWRNSHAPTDQFKEVINATKEEDNPMLLVFDFKK